MFDEKKIKMEEQFKEPKCFKSNNEAYSLCIGSGSKECRDCCLYEDYEVYNSPYQE